MRLFGALLLGAFWRVFCFFVSLREEHGLRKWRRPGLRLKRNEQQEEQVGEDEGENWEFGLRDWRGRHGGRLRGVRILSGEVRV